MEVDLLDEEVTVGGDHGYVFKFEAAVGAGRDRALAVVEVEFGAGHDLVVLALGNVLEHLEQVCNTGGVACEFREVLQRRK